ncbi:uncharacterized protein TNCV_961481 [Trichonephila clavipes]|uniref:Uncharacterized protein n=1 Tax=Trichonephila clavipes TaxID=2585209 RepID=A0A8X6VEZ5_TRICX|nr:uncharacterized protein TNCV_961481 [Trichonephila clavipes]
MFDPSSFANPTPLTHADASRDVLPRGGKSQTIHEHLLVSDVNEEFNRNNVKNFDANNLPTCKSALLQKFRRANYINSLWSNAHMKGLSIFSPENNGWTLEDKHTFQLVSWGPVTGLC